MQVFGAGRLEAGDVWLAWMHPRVAPLWDGQAHAGLMKGDLCFQEIHCLSDRRRSRTLPGGRKGCKTTGSSL